MVYRLNRNSRVVHAPPWLSYRSAPDCEHSCFSLLYLYIFLPSFYDYLWSWVVLVMITTVTYMFLFLFSGLMIYHISFLDMPLLAFASFSMQWGLDGKCIPSVYFEGFIHVVAGAEPGIEHRGVRLKTFKRIAACCTQEIGLTKKF
jgi:hypothetical protein